jgi:hypothetical protein
MGVQFPYNPFIGQGDHLRRKDSRIGGAGLADR